MRLSAPTAVNLARLRRHATQLRDLLSICWAADIGRLGLGQDGKNRCPFTPGWQNTGQPGVGMAGRNLLAVAARSNVDWGLAESGDALLTTAEFGRFAGLTDVLHLGLLKQSKAFLYLRNAFVYRGSSVLTTN
jgi:hypothetical protein